MTSLLQFLLFYPFTAEEDQLSEIVSTLVCDSRQRSPTIVSLMTQQLLMNISQCQGVDFTEDSKMKDVQLLASGITYFCNVFHVHTLPIDSFKTEFALLKPTDSCELALPPLSQANSSS